MSDKPRLLDLFCGAGGCTRGYQMAGFEVTGVDIRAQPRYCGDHFIQADALTMSLAGYDVIHASPPCLNFSIVTRNRWRISSDDRIERVRTRLRASGRPYVIENVPGAPLDSPLLLCGSMFGLGVVRHRLFETSVLIFSPFHPPHGGTVRGGGRYVTVTGHGGGEHGSVKRWPSAMGIVWMKRQELAQAIPPAYTHWIGTQLMAAVHDTPVGPRPQAQVAS